MLNIQEDDGGYYDCPALPGFTSHVRHDITVLAVDAFLETALKAAIDEVEEHGLAAIKKYLPVIKWDKEVEQ